VPRIPARAAGAEQSAGLPEDVHDQLRLAEGGALRTQLLAALPSASAADCARIAAWLPLTKRDAWDLLLLRWSETSLQAMSLWVLDHPPLGTRLAAEKCPAVFLSRGLWEAVLETDPAMALDHWYGRGCPVRLYVASASMRLMGHAAFLSWVDSHPALNRKLAGAWRQTAWKDWCSFDAQAALAFARTQKPDAMGELLPELAASDAAQAAAQAAALLESLPPEKVGAAAAAKVLGQLARKDADAAIAAVKRRFSGVGDQQLAARELFSALAQDGNPAALRVLAELPWRASDLGSGRGFADYPLGALFKKWAAREPEAAYAALASLPERLRYPTLGGDVFEVWAQKDPAGALAAADRLAAGDAARRGDLRSEVLRTWAEMTPDAAIAQVNRRGTAADMEEDVRAVQDGLMNGSIPEFLSYSLQLPVQFAGPRLIQMFAGSIPDAPALAARLEQTAPEDWKPVLAAGRLWGLVQKDGTQAPEAAAALTQLAAQLSPDWAGRVLRETAEQFVRVDKDFRRRMGGVVACRSPGGGHAGTGLRAAGAG
jgi:hypothetical protein